MRCKQSMDFGPRNAEEEYILAEESFRIDVQVAIHEAMQAKRVNQKELAKRLGLTEARVSQIFSDECNVTIRTLAKVFHALGETPKLTTTPAPKSDWSSTGKYLGGVRQAITKTYLEAYASAFAQAAGFVGAVSKVSSQYKEPKVAAPPKAAA